MHHQEDASVKPEHSLQPVSSENRRRLLQKGIALSTALGGAIALSPLRRAAAEEATPVAPTGTRFIAVRQYVIAEGVTYAEVAGIAEAGFLPLISAAPGFVAHYITDIGGGGLVAVSIWETEEAANNSSVIAADFVAANLADKFQGPPDEIKGSDTVYAEACVPAGPAATPTA
jgi:hypothetical protein